MAGGGDRGEAAERAPYSTLGTTTGREGGAEVAPPPAPAAGDRDARPGRGPRRGTHRPTRTARGFRDPRNGDPAGPLVRVRPLAGGARAPATVPSEGRSCDASSSCGSRCSCRGCWRGLLPSPEPRTRRRPPPRPRSRRRPRRPSKRPMPCVAAVAAKDDAGLKALAAKDDPDPWLVADELIRRGQHDAAERFAKAAPRKAVETLPRYVATRRSDARPDPDRAHVETVERALLAKAYEEALGLPSPASLETVSAIRVAYGQGTALQRLRRLDASETAFRGVAEAAQRLGWWRRAAAALDGAGASANDAGAARGARGMGGPTRPSSRSATGGARRRRWATSASPTARSATTRGPRGLRGGVGGAAERRGSGGDDPDVGQHRDLAPRAASSRPRPRRSSGPSPRRGPWATERSRRRATLVLGTLYRLRGEPARALAVAEQAVTTFEAAGSGARRGGAREPRTRTTRARSRGRGARELRTRAGDVHGPLRPPPDAHRARGPRGGASDAGRNTRPRSSTTSGSSRPSAPRATGAGRRRRSRTRLRC